MSIREWLVRANTTRNVATWDRWVRASLLPLTAVGWLTGLISGVAAIVLAVISAMLFPTAVTGACSIYYAAGVSTRRDEPRPTPTG